MANAATITIHLADHPGLVRYLEGVNEILVEALEIPGVREKLEPRVQITLKQFAAWKAKRDFFAGQEARTGRPKKTK